MVRVRGSSSHPPSSMHHQPSLEVLQEMAPTVSLPEDVGRKSTGDEARGITSETSRGTAFPLTDASPLPSSSARRLPFSLGRRQPPLVPVPLSDGGGAGEAGAQRRSTTQRMSPRVRFTTPTEPHDVPSELNGGVDHPHSRSTQLPLATPLSKESTAPASLQIEPSDRLLPDSRPSSTTLPWTRGDASQPRTASDLLDRQQLAGTGKEEEELQIGTSTQSAVLDGWRSTSRLTDGALAGSSSVDNTGADSLARVGQATSGSRLESSRSSSARQGSSNSSSSTRQGSSNNSSTRYGSGTHSRGDALRSGAESTSRRNPPSLGRIGSFAAALRGSVSRTHRGNLLSFRGNPDRRSGRDAEGRGRNGSGDALPVCPNCLSSLEYPGGYCTSCNDVTASFLPNPEPPPSSERFRPFCMLRPPPSSCGQPGSEIKGWGHSRWWFGRVIDPRTRHARAWIRFYFFIIGFSLVLDPSFLYSLSFTASSSCLYIEAIYATTVAVLRTACDTFYLLNSLLAFRTAFVSERSMVLGQGELVFDAQEIARNHFSRLDGLLLDVVVTLPIPQCLLFGVSVALVNAAGVGYSGVDDVASLIYLVLVVQYCMKVYHAIDAASKVQRVNGYVFGTTWWGLMLNFLIFIIAAHTFGSLWYIESVSSAVRCLQQQCDATAGCQQGWIGCSSDLSFGIPPPESPERAAWGGPGSNVSQVCFTTGAEFSWDYGIYEFAVQLLQDTNGVARTMYGLFFGMMTMATFGNALVPAPDAGQAIFAFFMVLSGLLLFTTLIGNIDVFLRSMVARFEDMHTRRRNMDWWMRRRQLDTDLQVRVRTQERQTFIATRGIREDELLDRLPASLRRDVKRQICGPLVREVPVFEYLDESVIDHICARLRPVVLIPGSEAVRQGEPVEEMLFIVRGRMQSTHAMLGGATSVCDIGPGAFTGEELLSWSLSRAADDIRLPMAIATLSAAISVDAFSLSAHDLCFITTHFRFQLRDKKLRSLIRFYSPHWRMWAAVTIQLWWRRRRSSRMKASRSPSQTARALEVCTGEDPAAPLQEVQEQQQQQPEEEQQDDGSRSQDDGSRSLHRGDSSANMGRMRLYASIFSAPKPRDTMEASRRKRWSDATDH